MIGDDGSSHMKAYYGRLSGTAVTAPVSNSATISAANISNTQRWTRIESLDGTYAIATWINNDATPRACVVTVLGNTPSGTAPISPSILSASPFNYQTIVAKKIDSTHALLAWGFDVTVTGNTHIQAVVASLSSGTISTGTTIEVYNPGTAATPNMVTVAMPNSTQAVVGFSTGADMRIGVVTISGSSLAARTTYEVTASTSISSGLCEIGKNYCGFFYPDNTDSSHSKLTILSPV
jgi:hypothetical protein